MKIVDFKKKMIDKLLVYLAETDIIFYIMVFDRS